MALFEVDPRPLLPRGFRLVQWPPEEELPNPADWPRVYLGPWRTKKNEDVALAFFHPPVASEDFYPMASALREYLVDRCHAHSIRIEQSAIGSAIVTFDSSLEREGFIRANPHSLGPYTVRFIRHDEGPNAKDVDLDRVVWLMLVGYPLDFANDDDIAKAVSGFGDLLHWHQETSKGRVIVKLLMNDGAKIPRVFLATVGDMGCARSFTVLTVRLQEEGINLLGDEVPPPDDGPAHPLPPSPPRWMGVQVNVNMGPVDQAGNAHFGHNFPSGHHHARNRSTSSDDTMFADPEMENVLQPAGEDERDAVADFVVQEPLAAVQGMGYTLAVGDMPLSQPGSVTDLSINLKCSVRSLLAAFVEAATEPELSIFGPQLPSFQDYFNCVADVPRAMSGLNLADIQVTDAAMGSVLVHRTGADPHHRFIIKLITMPRFFSSCVIEEVQEDATTRPSTRAGTDEITSVPLNNLITESENVHAEKEVEYSADTPMNNSHDIAFEAPRPTDQTPRRRRRKTRVPIDVKLLRRSPRLNPKLDGFRSREAADAAAALQVNYMGAQAHAGEPPAPHLSTALVQGIGEMFLQMNPSDLSAEILEASPPFSDDDEEDY
ncbi:unnamed protein product [Urochloa humidicola]